jgi:hypothetical protein
MPKGVSVIEIFFFRQIDYITGDINTDDILGAITSTCLGECEFLCAF